MWTNQFRRYTLHSRKRRWPRAGTLHSRHQQLTVHSLIRPRPRTVDRTIVSSGLGLGPVFSSGDERGSRVSRFALFGFLHCDSRVAIDYGHGSQCQPFGSLPAEPLWDGPADDFVVRVEVHVTCVADTTEAQTRSFIRVGPISPMRPSNTPPKLRAGDEKRYPSTHCTEKRGIDCGGPIVLERQPLYILELAIKHDSDSDGHHDWMQNGLDFVWPPSSL
jgi:hypothetical protein